jgi:hypothetical protein
MENYSDYHMYVLEKYSVDCIDVVKLLGDYYDQDLHPSLQQRLENHVCECKYCQELDRSYRLVVEVARTLRQAEKPMSSTVKVRLRQALNQRLGLKLRVEAE